MSITRLAGALLFALFAFSEPALAQSAKPQDNLSISVTTGNTYQAIAPADGERRMLEIQNNNTNTDTCLINVDGVVAVGKTTSSTVTNTAGASVTAAQASILLQPGQAYTRYFPNIPTGPIVGTCASSTDSLYADITP